MSWLVKLCVLPTPAPDDAGNASFLGPSPEGSHGAARARPQPQNKQPKKNSSQASTETQTQQHTVNSGLLWLGPRARAPKPKNQCEKNKDRAAHEPAATRAKRTKRQPKAQQSNFLTVFTAFFWARTKHGWNPQQRLAPKCAKTSLAYIPSVPSKKQSFVGGEAFCTEVSMMQTKPR